MLRVTYSNSTEALIRALGRRLPRDPFEGATIIVPNRAMERVVERGLARVEGLVIHVRFERLEPWVIEALGGRDIVLDTSSILARILALLADDTLLPVDPALAPLERYLAAGGDDPRERDRRRSALASALAEALSGYARTRPDWLAAWARGEPAPTLGDADPALERWQAALFRQVRALGGPRLTLSELLARDDLEPRGDRGPAFVIGVSYMAPVFHQALARLARGRDVELLAFNPCREFWSDVGSRAVGRRRLASRREAEPLESSLLEAWGRPGREHVLTLDEAVGYDASAAYVSPRGEGTLARVQRSILERTRVEPGQPDGSLVVLPCPSVRREVETVLSLAWGLVVESDRAARLDPTASPLHLNEIALLLPPGERDLYLSHLEAAMEAVGEASIAATPPWSGQDLRLVARSRAVEAAHRLLSFFGAEPTRPEVLGLVGHPLVGGALALASLEEWAELVEGVGIVRGIDERDLRGTYADRSSGEGAVLHFDQGLARLAVGCALGTRGPDEGRLAARVEGETDRILGATTLLRSLLADHRALAPARLAFSAWAELFAALVRAYVVPETSSDEAELERALAALRRLARYDVLDAEGEPLARHGLELALGLARRALEELPAVHGDPQARGLTVASLLPLRSIPFRVVFALGLEEGRFPGRSVDRGLDLRVRERRVGDVSEEESDRYAFLETLVSTRERLFLSYVARDEVTGDPHAPSSVIADLALATGQGGLLEARPPPARWQALEPAHGERDWLRGLGLDSAEARAALAAMLGDAALEREVRALGDAERAEYAGLRATNDAWARLSPDDPRREDLRLPALPAPLPEERAVRLDALRRFLACPAQGRASHWLRGRADASPLLFDEEPLELDASMTHRLARATLTRALERGLDDAPVRLDTVLDASLDAIVARARGSARVPIGALGASAVGAVREQVRALIAVLLEARPDARLAYAVRFGAPSGDRSADEARLEVRATLALDPDPRAPTLADPSSPAASRLLLEGRTRAFLRAPGDERAGDALRVSFAQVLGDAAGARIERGVAELDAYVDHALLAAAGEALRARRLVLVGRDGVHEAVLPGLGQGEATRWLRGLALELRAAVDPAPFLPIEAILLERDAIVRGAPGLAARLLRTLEAMRARPLRSSADGPLAAEDVALREAPEPRELEAIVGRRHALPLTQVRAVTEVTRLDPEGLLR